MSQELTDLKNSILEGRYEEAIALVDRLQAMSQQAIITTIESSLVIFLANLIKNQVELRLTNAWVAAICESIRQIKKLNFQTEQNAYYIQQQEWQPFLEEAFESAIASASVEIEHGKYNPIHLEKLVDRDKILTLAQDLLLLTYTYSAKELPAAIYRMIANLPGGEEWLLEEKG